MSHTHRLAFQWTILHPLRNVVYEFLATSLIHSSLKACNLRQMCFSMVGFSCFPWFSTSISKYGDSWIRNGDVKFFPSQNVKLVYSFELLSIKPMKGNGVVYLTMLVPMYTYYLQARKWIMSLYLAFKILRDKCLHSIYIRYKLWIKYTFIMYKIHFHFPMIFSLNHFSCRICTSMISSNKQRQQYNNLATKGRE